MNIFIRAFKYDDLLQEGVGTHADAAALNINFWVTPDTAVNTEGTAEQRGDPQGGIVILNVSAPPDWNFEQYNYNSPEVCLQMLLIQFLVFVCSFSV